MRGPILAMLMLGAMPAFAQDGAASFAKYEVERMSDDVVPQPTNCQNHNPDDQACIAFGPLPLPTSVDEFLALRDDLMARKNELTKIYGGAVLFLQAMLVRNDNRELGDKMLVISLARDNLARWEPKGWSGSKVDYKGYTWNRATSSKVNTMDDAPYMIRSYVKGTNPIGRYEVDTSKPMSWAFRRQNKFNSNPETSNTYKVFVCTGGQPTCRPIVMVKNNRGIWKVDEFDTLAVSINVGPPVGEDAFDDDI